MARIKNYWKEAQKTLGLEGTLPGKLSEYIAGPDDLMGFLSPMGFTKMSAIQDIATGLKQRVPSTSEGALGGIPRLVEDATRIYPESHYAPIQGPNPMPQSILDPKQIAGWGYLPEQVTHEYRFINDTMIPTGRSRTHPPEVLFDPRELSRALEARYGGGLGTGPSGSRYIDIEPRTGRIVTPEEYFLEEVASMTHELGHKATKEIPEQVWRDMFQIPSGIPLHADPSWTIHPRMRELAGLSKQEFASLKGMEGYLPQFMLDQYRPEYWMSLTVPQWQQQQRIMDEAIADWFALVGLGRDPMATMPMLIPEKEPLLQFLRR